MSIIKRLRSPVVFIWVCCPFRSSCPRGMTGGLFDQKYDPTLITFRDLNAISGFADQIGNIDHRQWIGTMYLQKVAQTSAL